MTGEDTAAAAVPHAPPGGLRPLVVVLGDQLDEQSSAFDAFDAGRDAA